MRARKTARPEFDPTTPDTSAAQTKRAPKFTVADAKSPPARSPARALQGELSARFPYEPAGTSWSKRATLLFIVGSCGAFWAAAAGVAAILMRA